MRESIFGDLNFFPVSGQGKCAASIGTIHFFIWYPENVKYPPDKNFVSFSSGNIVGKLAYLSVKVTSLDQKHKIAIKVANISVSELHILFNGITLSGKLPISV